MALPTSSLLSTPALNTHTLIIGPSNFFINSSHLESNNFIGNDSQTGIPAHTTGGAPPAKSHGPGHQGRSPKWPTSSVTSNQALVYNHTPAGWTRPPFGRTQLLRPPPNAEDLSSSVCWPGQRPPSEASVSGPWAGCKQAPRAAHLGTATGQSGPTDYSPLSTKKGAFPMFPTSSPSLSHRAPSSWHTVSLVSANQPAAPWHRIQ